MRLIEQNLLKLKSHLKRDSEIREVWEKELKVITEMKRKIKLKIPRKTHDVLYLCKTDNYNREEEEESEGELNPEGEWESLVKEAIKLAIE